MGRETTVGEGFSVPGEEEQSRPISRCFYMGSSVGGMAFA